MTNQSVTTPTDTTNAALANRPEELPFHPTAVQLAKVQVSNFSIALFRLAQLIAFRRRNEMVLSEHVVEALESIQNAPKRKRLSEAILFASSVILGISGQGFIGEMLRFRADPSSGDVTLAIIYGITSIIMAVIAAVTFTRT